jgi:hypothetical protein
MRRTRVLLAITATACGAAVDPSSGSGRAEGEGPTAPAGSEPAPARCEAETVIDVEVAGEDLDGYPPYAVEGCALAYVSSEGELVLRDLATGLEAVIAPALEAPRRPAVSRELVAWEATFDGRSVVRVKRGSRAPETLAGGFVSAGEPRASGRSVSFTAWNGPADGDDTDVWLYDAAAGELRPIFSGPGQQRFSDVSEGHVVATDFSEDPDGRYDGVGDLADILVFDRATGEVTARQAPGKQAFPMLVDGATLGYLEWGLVHPEPKLERYDLRVGSIRGLAGEDRTLASVSYPSPQPVRPAAVAGVVEWIDDVSGHRTLFRADVARSTAPTKVDGPPGVFLHAPAPAEGFTVIAARAAPELDPPRLRAVAR